MDTDFDYSNNNNNVQGKEKESRAYSSPYDNNYYGAANTQNDIVKSSPSANGEYRENTFRSPYDYSAFGSESSSSSDFVRTGGSYTPSSNDPYNYNNSQNSVRQSYTPNDFNKPKNKKRGGKKAIGFVAAICAVLLASGGAFYAGVRYTDNAIQANADASSSSTSNIVANAATVAVADDSGEVTSSITEVVENAMPSMVSINTIIKTSVNDTYGYFFGYMFGDGYQNSYETNASGSGIIIGQNEEELLIVTNNHVVEDASEIAVEFIDGQSYNASIKGTSSDNDLAVISVPLSDIGSDTLSQIKVAVMGDSTTLKLGEPAIAIGNALGYGQSVTVGYISATSREVQLTDNTMTLIQTDAAINPGNSGGALLNIKGEVIGINSAKYSDTSVEGTGYAIPISDATPIINELMSTTYVPEEEKPYLGIYGQSVPASYQERFGWPEGVYVSQVKEGSPSSLAGLQRGDIITKFNDTEVTSMEDLQTVLENCAVGDTVELSIARYSNGKLQEDTLQATLIARGDIEE